MSDPFKSHSRGVDAPALGFVAITPSNDPLPTPIRGFRVGTTAGDVEVTDSLGVTTVIPNVQVGEEIDGFITHILPTNTAAEGITGFI